LWYFGAEEGYHTHFSIARIIESSLREAAEFEAANVFRILGDRLISEQYAIGTGLVLAVLLDCLRQTPARAAWHEEEAARLLMESRIQRYPSLSDVRRLLRRELHIPSIPDVGTRIANVIRDGAHSEEERCYELADIAAWSVLSEDEKLAIEETREAGQLYEPRDPRDEPAIRVDANPPPYRRRQPDWPHPEDHEYIEELSESAQRETEPSSAEFQQNLLRRLEGLKSVLDRSEARMEPWLGEILGWCHRAVTDLRSLLRLRHTPDQTDLAADEWRENLDANAGWWQGLAGLALDRLGGEVPASHNERHSGGLSWGSNDPIFQSLCYLDEVLAIEPQEPFQQYQQSLAEAVDATWDRWPPFTRATALSVLRPWYWHRFEKLHTKLAAIAEAETNPLVVKYGLRTLFDLRWPNLAEFLDQLLRRAMTMPELSDSVRQIGIQLGHAVMVHRCAQAASPRFEAMAAVFEGHKATPLETTQNADRFVDGVLWGATDFLKQAIALTDCHANCWLGIVNWAIGAWPGFDARSDDDRFPLTPVSVGLEQSWPDSLQKRVYEGVGNPFLRILKEGTLGDFCSLHHAIDRDLEGKMRRSAVEQGSDVMIPIEPPFSDDFLVRLCQESVARVGEWRAEDKRTNDLGWAAGLSGHDSGQLIQKVIEHCRDRGYIRRMLPPVIDRLAEAGCSAVAAELRVRLRRR
jgi:hypothetical protein